MERVVVFPCHAVKSELFRAAVLGQADASSSKDELHRSNIFWTYLNSRLGTIGKLENHKPCNRLFMLCSNKYAPGCDTVLPAYWGRRQGDRYCVCLPVQIHEKPSGTEISSSSKKVILGTGLWKFWKHGIFNFLLSRMLSRFWIAKCGSLAALVFRWQATQSQPVLQGLFPQDKVPGSISEGGNQESASIRE